MSSPDLPVDGKPLAETATLYLKSVKYGLRSGAWPADTSDPPALADVGDRERRDRDAAADKSDVVYSPMRKWADRRSCRYRVRPSTPCRPAADGLSEGRRPRR